MKMKKYIEIIEKELKKCFDDPRFEEHPLITEAMAYTTLLPSKKLRAILCLEACRIFSGSFDHALPTACAVEMLHSQSLIHDDLPCMDNDDLRRGKLSNHKVYGEGIAVLAGDALISLGVQTIIEKTPEVIPREAVLEIVRRYSNVAGTFGIVGGQVADIISEGKKIKPDKLEFIHKYKTGSMFDFALATGAMLGGADDNKRAAIHKFAHNFGLAFQIRDDILDATSTSDVIGKTTGKDEISKKATYVTLFGLEESSEKLDLLIQNCYGIMNAEGIISEIFDEILRKIS